MRFNPHAFNRTQKTPPDPGVPAIPASAGVATAGYSDACAAPPPAVAAEHARSLTAFILQYGRPNADKVVVPDDGLKSLLF